MNERIKELAEQTRIKDHWSIDEARYLTNYLDEQKVRLIAVSKVRASNPTDYKDLATHILTA